MTQIAETRHAIAIEPFKIAYSAVPKAGSTSIKRALAGIDPAVTVPAGDPTDEHTWHGLYPTKRFRPEDWPPLIAEDWFRFCAVRDPVKRILSCYSNRILQFRDLENCRRIKNGEFDLPTLPDPDFFFQNLRQYRKASASVRLHTQPSSLFLGPDFAVYSTVYTMSDLGRLETDIGAITGQTVILPRENSSVHKLDLADLQPKTVAGLDKFLEGEYTHLARYYASPF